MSNFYELCPAYGRDYKTSKEVIAAFNADKDFMGDYQLGFSPINKYQIEKPCTVLLRYKNNTMVVSLKVK